MVNIEAYISELIQRLKDVYGFRLLYVGLQGSFLRGEATEHSDIDILTLLDDLTAEDLAEYRAIVKSMPYADLSCGFLCGKEDLAHWNPLEIWNLENGTKDYYGHLQDYTPDYTDDDIRNFAKLSLNNLYHALCHGYVNSASGMTESKLTGAYKSVFFILQALYYLSHRKYIATKAQLLPLLAGKDRTVMEQAIFIQQGNPFYLSESFSLLFTWCQESMHSL